MLIQGELWADGVSGQRGNKTTAHLCCHIVPVSALRVCATCSIHHGLLGITTIYSSFILNQDWSTVPCLSDGRWEKTFHSGCSIFSVWWIHFCIQNHLRRNYAQNRIYNLAQLLWLVLTLKSTVSQHSLEWYTSRMTNNAAFTLLDWNR